MPRDLNLPQLESNYRDSCPHMPDHFVWQSNDGPIPVCMMADSHLVRARDGALDWRESDDKYEALDALEQELERRGLGPKY